MRSDELISSDEPLVERIAEEILERQRAGDARKGYAHDQTKFSIGTDTK